MKLSLIANSLTGSEINKIASEIKQKIAKGQKVFNPNPSLGFID